MAKRHIVPITIVATVLFASIGLTASAIENPQAMPVGAEPTDATLNDKVETLLRTDIGLAGSQFRVQTKAGVVTLGKR
jgi:hyperosmotically inducible periplasmic protein